MTIEPDRPERILEWMIGEQYDFGITDGFAGHPAIESTNLEIRTVCVFPSGHEFEGLEVITPTDMATQNIIHTRRDSEFFSQLAKAFQREQATFNSLLEIRQFTAACELYAKERAWPSCLNWMPLNTPGRDLVSGRSFRPFRTGSRW